jgi:hypothetical protein
MTSAESITTAGATLSIWRDAPSLEGLRTAALGAFACETPEQGAKAIRDAMAKLKADGFEAIIGPMDGDTWGKHRLVVETDGRPPFLMEPHNPPHYVDAFNASGLRIVSRYVSSERPAEIAPSNTPPVAGLALRQFDTSNPEAELRRIHALSLEAFAFNPFYVPISAERFIDSYRPVLKVIDPDLVFLAEDGAGDLKAFLFALPNFAEGEFPKSVILKTYASRVKGGGSLLANAFHDRARRRGYARVIHALMHESNLSAQHSGNSGGKVFRRYALWGGRL